MSHEKTHTEHHDRVCKRNNEGSVKIRGARYSDAPPAEADVPPVDTAVACPADVSADTHSPAVNGSVSAAAVATACPAGMPMMNYNDDYGSDDNDEDDADALCASFFPDGPTKLEDGEEGGGGEGGGGDGDIDAVGITVVRQRDLHTMELVTILDEYHKKIGENMSKHAFIKYAAIKYIQPKLQRSSLNKWLRREEEIRASARKSFSHRCSRALPPQKVGQYPEMEYRLQATLRHLRMLGMPIETWMVRAEAKLLLHELYPRNFPDLLTTDEKSFPFKGSSMWMRGFFSRHNFCLQKIGKRMNKQGVTKDMMKNIE